MFCFFSRPSCHHFTEKVRVVEQQIPPNSQKKYIQSEITK